MGASDAIAGLSFVVSGMALGWTMFRDLADRPSLRVGCFIGRMAGRGIRDERDYIVWSITNSGRRPIVVEHVGGEFKEKDKNFIIVPHAPLPRTLQPYETFTEYSDDLESAQNLRTLCVWDTLGKKYVARRNKLEKVKKELANPAATRGTVPQIPPEEDF